MINFRDTLAKYKHLTLMGINNALSARLAEQAGFQALWSSSLEVSASHGVPDASFLGMNQFVEAAHQAQTAVDIPILADCDSGYGHSMNVAYMVRSYEDAGITAVCMEDNLFPKVNSLLDQRRTILGADEFVQKIVAAKSAQREDSFFVMARTESFIAGESVDELLARAEAYREAGADALLFHAKAPHTEKLREALTCWGRKLPVAVVPTAYPRYSAPHLQEAGADIVIFANQGMRAAVRAMQDVFATLSKHGSLLDVEEQIAPVSDIFECQDLTEWRRLADGTPA